MTKTLFWYIFGALFRVFMMTTGALSGMLSFAVLLRPLTENGLDFAQVNKLLLYSTPAVCAYSLPVAALFATTMVYGRFAADNELTAMRGSGISYFSFRRFSISLPAVTLGLVVAVISMVLLCFVVPIYSLKMEEVVYANIGRVIAAQIDRTHSLQFTDSNSRSFNVYADDARLLPEDPEHPNLQRVELIGPAWMRYDLSPTNPNVAVPREFWMAEKAFISIDRPSPSTPAMVTVSLNGGIKFPRVFFGNVQVGVGSTGFGPFEIPSPIAENVKFMNVTQLSQLAQDPSQSHRVQTLVRNLRRQQQQLEFLTQVRDKINDRAADGTSSFWFAGESQESDSFQIGAKDATCSWRGTDLVIVAPGTPDNRSVWMQQMHGSQITLFANAKEINIRATPDDDLLSANDQPAYRMNVTIELFNLELQTQNNEKTPRGSFSRSFSVPMSPELRAIASKTLVDFMRDPIDPPDTPPALNGNWRITFPNYFSLKHDEIWANNSARSELHGRASFAVSCVSLVLVGCGLGVMFRSGNFLNAFAASFVPALLCMTLIVSGQQTATHVPYPIHSLDIKDPLPMSLVFIWVGNVVTLFAAIYLTYRLQKR
jgi:lipopolysaccharide export LptBFGC system permease protein LptF